MQKRNVLFVAHHLTVGGVQKSLVSALNAIDYESNNVTLYLRKNRTDLLPYINRNVKVIINDDTRHYYRTPRAILYQFSCLLARLLHNKSLEQKRKDGLADYIRKRQMEYEYASFFADSSYDIAISYVQGVTTEFVSQYVSAKKKVTFYQVSTDEAHDIHERTLPCFDQIVVEHAEIKNSLSEWYRGIVDPNRIFILENYVDVDLLRRQGSEFTIERVGNRPIICSCGRFAGIKGFDLAVNAARILRQRGHEFLWYVVGDGPERPNIEKIISDYRLQDCVKLTGMLTNPYPYIMGCDIYVQPSKEEGLSIAMLEALLLERPMVTTKTVGGCTMVVDGQNGVLTEINAESLADGIERLLKESQLRERIQNELKQNDYSEARRKYQRDWAALLEA